MNLTPILELHKAFFCFSQKQFDEQKTEGVEYVSMGGGLICPKENAKALRDDIKAESKRSINEDLANNSTKEIIWRELANHEAQISCSIEDTLSALQGYGITADEVAAEYTSYFDHCVQNDLF